MLDSSHKSKSITGRKTGISSVLFSKAMGKLLTLFFNNPDKTYYQKAIEQAVGLPHGSFRIKLQQLVHAGILTSSLLGKKKFYAVNRDCPVFEELKSLVQKTVGMVEPIREALEPLRDRIKVAFIFGSVATGEDTGRSDVDLMVVGGLSLRDLSVALYPLDETLKRPINPHLYTPERLTEAFRANDHFIRSISKTKLVYLIGSENDFRGMDK